MKTHVPCSLAFFALLLVLVAEGPAFLPSARAQAAQAGAAVAVQPRAGAETQLLRGHVPAVLAQLQPIGRLAATNRLKLAIGLPLRNPQALAQFLEQLHNPAHPNYRHYLTPEEFAARFGPTEQDYTAVAAFAQANGLTVTGRHPNRTLLDVSGSVADIEKALHLTLGVYQHPVEARTFYAPEVEPSLDLAVPVLDISGLNNYSLPRPRLHATPLDQQPKATSNTGSGPGGTYMGIDFRAAYVPGSPVTGAGQVVGLLQFDDYTASDIIYYESQAGLPNVPLTNVLLDGFGGNPTGSGGEVEVCLDIETSISMAPGLAGVMVYMAGPYGNWHDILNRMATDNLAKQLSCSWYSPGGGPDPVTDQIFQQMAAQGQSFFSASGDYDAFSGPVDFPGETPYIVQVGGTTLTTSGPGGAWVSETVWNRNNGIGSGGGISTRYAIPSYQTNVNMTLNQGSTTMRNIPDVALTAENVYVRADGGDWSVGGTSCAAPLWAGFTALVNQQAVASGKPTVGFINPVVDVIGSGATYNSCFHDITTGNNTSASSPRRFYAVAGYDLCTGWGTPAGQNLINALATPDPLLISPLALAFSGGVGGPFSPNPGSLTLTNTGTNALNWTLVNPSGWFDVSPTSGTLLPGGAAASVSASVDASADTLSPGVYTAVLAFTNQTSGVAQTCSLALSVAGLGMADNFDPGLDLSQWSSFGGVVGSTVLATNYGGSVSAPNSLWFGNAGSRFATTIPINTSGGGEIGFCIRLANGPAWPWAQVNNLPAEGVVLECSTNGGGSWTAIGNYDTQVYYNWTGVTLAIPAVAEAPTTLFRWRQLSNSGTNYDNWALDNVIIGTGLMGPRIVMDPQNQTVVETDIASLSVAAVGTAPLSYQWLLNGSNIDGATASSLVWTNVQFADAGTYSVLLSNSVGTILSSNAILTVNPPPPCAPPPPGLLSWWRAEGNCLDWVGTNDGTLQNQAGFGRGRVGQTFSFDGINDYVKIPKSPSLDVGSQVTIEFWMNADPSTPIGSRIAGLVTSDFYGIEIGGSPLGVMLFISTSSGASFFSTADVNGGGAVFPAGAWHHVAGTYDGAKLQLYLDGQSWGNPRLASGPISPMLANSFVTIGSEDGRTMCGNCIGTRYFKGLIDEVSIYNRALSANEIAAIYAAGLSGKCATPSAPAIFVQPTNQTVTTGATVNFLVTAGGTPPLSYQWQFNGTNLDAATGASLALTNVQLTQAGSYTVQVTNMVGSVISSNAVLTVNPPPPCETPPSGLISWWAGEGNANDSLGLNNGALHGGAGFTPGEVGQAFSLNGTSGYIGIPKSPSLDVGSQVTIDFWVNADPSAPIGSRIAGMVTSDFYGIEVGGSPLGVSFFMSTNSGGYFLDTSDVNSGGAVFPAGQWHHVAATYDGAKMQLYLDGQPWGNPRLASGPISPMLANSFVAIGSEDGRTTCGNCIGTRYFKGLIDEVDIFNRALSASEIAAIYEAGVSGKCGLPPSILNEPENQTVAAGGNLTFTVAVAGTPPLSYQWQYNGTNLNAATGASLVLSNIQPTQAGSYAVQVTNRLGSVLSSNAVLTVTPPPPCATPPSGLISWWAGEGNANDSLGRNNGALHGGAGFAPGEVGQAFSVDGTSGYVGIPKSPSLDVGSQVTIDFWMNADPSTPIGSRIAGLVTSDFYGVEIDSSPPGVIFFLSTNSGAYFLATSDANSGGAVFPAGQWHHVAATYDGTKMQLYLDGQPWGNPRLASGPISPMTASSFVSIGSEDGRLYCPSCTANRYFKGLIDEVDIFNRALSASEIAAIYDAGVAGKCDPQPVIVTPPQSQTVEYSSNVNFSVFATGLSPLSYRWYFGTNSISGATNTLLTLTNVGFAQAGDYSVVVTNTYGSATGGPAMLTVVDTIPPTIIACASNRTLSVGANCTASLPDLTGEVVAWDASGPVTVTQNPFPGTLLNLGMTNVVFTVQDSSSNASVCVSTLTVADTTPPFVLACVLELTLGFDTNCQALLPDLTTTNYIIASDNCSSVSVAQAPPALTAMPAGTNTVLLTVSDSASNQTTRAVTVIVPGQPLIAVQPAKLTVAVSSNAAFSVLACGAAPLLYQWQHSSTNLPSGTNVVLTLSNISTNDAGDYQVVITNSFGSITSAVARLTVLQPPVITRQPRSVIAAPGATVTFSVTAKGLTPLAYLWQKTGAPLAGQTKASLIISNVQPADFAGYAVGITNTDGGVLSAVATLTLASSPVVNSLSFNLSTFMLTVPTEVGPTYVVEYKDDWGDPSWNVLATISGTGSSIPITDNGLTNATRFYRVRVR